MGAEDPANFGLTFTLSLDHLGQSVEVPLGGELLRGASWAACRMADLAAHNLDHPANARMFASLCRDRYPASHCSQLL